MKYGSRKIVNWCSIELLPQFLFIRLNYSLHQQQQQQRLIPLGGVGYMDQLTPSD